MPESPKEAQKEMPASTSKLSTAREKLPVPDQKPVAPGHARVVVQVVKILPALETSGNGPCSKTPCQAEVKVIQVIGYGSGFSQSLGEGQQVRAYFPMTMKAVNGRPGVTQGQNMTAELRASLRESDPLVVRSYALLD
ncbi:hypothetical protein [Rufibacter latericius]|nr:hypothetical protein [Rufibacter latericius]